MPERPEHDSTKGGGSARGEVPAFVALAAHPIRWNLLTELARSDGHVTDLTRLLDEPQALVSYHLGLLRDGGLVRAKKSSFDGRASYYRIDLQRCRDALAASGGLLHPGLRTGGWASDEAGSEPNTRRTGVSSVLFTCTGNSARSPIAAALMEQLSGGRVRAVSAGSHPKPMHANTIKVLASRGIDVAGRQPKSLSELSGREFDYVVTLCDKVREVCPEFPTRERVIHWSLEDPARSTGKASTTYPLFKAMAADLEIRLRFFLASIDAETIRTSSTSRKRNMTP